MKKFIATALLALTLMGSGCTQQTSYGQCEGVFTEEDRKPDLRYRASAWNVVLGIIFIETIVVPVYVVGWDLYCPVGKK